MAGCLKGESEVKKKDAKFACSKCGAAAGKKDHLCKPEKLKDQKQEKQDKKGKKEKKKKK